MEKKTVLLRPLAAGALLLSLAAHADTYPSKPITLVVPFGPGSATDTIARVHITALAQGNAVPIDGLQDVEVAPGGRITVQLAQHVSSGDLPVLVEADRPVFVERGLYAGKGKGISLAAGIPIAESVTLPRTPASTTTTTTGTPPPSS